MDAIKSMRNEFMNVMQPYGFLSLQYWGIVKEISQPNDECDL